MSATSITVSSAELRRLPIFPLSSVVLLPNSILPLHIFESRYKALTEDALRNDSPIAMAMTTGTYDPDGKPDFCPIAGVGKIYQHERLPDGRFVLLLLGVARVRILHELHVDTPYRQARAVFLHDRIEDTHAASSMTQTLNGCILGLRFIDPGITADLSRMLEGASGEGAVADRLASVLFPAAWERQQLLEEPLVERRLRMVVDRLTELLARASDVVAHPMVIQ